MLKLGSIVVDDIQIVRMALSVVLMILLGLVERLQRRHACDDRAVKYVGRTQLRDVGLGDALLLRIPVKNDRSVLHTGVGPLSVELSGIVAYREEHAQQLAVGDLFGIVSNLYRLGVLGGTAAHDWIARRGCRAARIT